MPTAPWTPDRTEKISEKDEASLASFTVHTRPFLYANRDISIPILARKIASRGHRSDAALTARNGPKRIFDLVVSAGLLAILSPALILLAALVRLNGPGPVIYRQTRVGAKGENFTLLKFRTMHQSEKFLQATVNDRRVTSVGRVLRRTSLDELPQLFNVMKGDMSLVGPRPHAAETRVQGVLFEDAVKSYWQRHRVKPGITGLAQIRGQRGETRTIRSFEQRLASDMEYIENWSIRLDIMILLKTVPVLFGQDNAY